MTVPRNGVITTGDGRDLKVRTFVSEPGDPEGFARWANTFRDWGLVCSERRGEDGTRELVIDHAEPRTTITRELVEVIAEGSCPFARLVWPDGRDRDPVFGTHVGAMLRVEASNRTVVYRLVCYEFGPDWYVAEWPD